MAPAEHKRPLKCCLFLTGPPGVGKTTLLRAALRRLAAAPDAPLVFGFYVAEVRASPAGPRLGYDVRDLATGRAEPLARLDDSAEARGPDYGPRVGRYRVRARAFDAFATASLGPAPHASAAAAAAAAARPPPAKLFIADEVGAFESHSPMFARRLRQLLDGAAARRRKPPPGGACAGAGEPLRCAAFAPHLSFSSSSSSSSFPSSSSSHRSAAHAWFSTSAAGTPPPPARSCLLFRPESEDRSSFDDGGVVFGTVALKSGGALAGEIRARKDVYIVEVTRANRDCLLDHVVNVLLLMLANRWTCSS